VNHDYLASLTRLPRTWDDIPGMFDFAALYSWIVAEAPAGSILVEVGSYLGRSVCHLGSLAKSADKSLSIVAVDRCTGSTSDETGQGLTAALGGSYAGVLSRNVDACGLGEAITVIVGDSARTAQLFADKSVFAVFLDADHSEESLARDIAAWRPKIRKNGLLAGHDLDHPAFPGVRRAVEAAFPKETIRPDPRSPSCWCVRV
jgi:predicted O-methyltransferase YrrM